MASLAATLKEFFEFWKDLKLIYAFWQKNRDEDWFQSSREVFDKLAKPITPEEKQDAVSRLRDLVGRL